MSDGSPTLPVTASKLKLCVRAMFNASRVPFIWGGVGIGKSEIMGQIATDLGIALLTVYLSQRAPEDLGGMPFPTKEHGIPGVRFSKPFILPSNVDIASTAKINGRKRIHFVNPMGENGIVLCKDVAITVQALSPGHTATIVDRGYNWFDVDLRDNAGEPVKGKISYAAFGEADALLFTDEFNSACLETQAAAYSFLLNGRIGEWTAPKGVHIAAAGNRDTDRGQTYKMPTPVMNRIGHYNFEVDFKEWQTHAINSGEHPAVVGFLSKFPESLNKFDPQSAFQGFETPRSWHFISEWLYANPNAPSDVARLAFCGFVGVASGTIFSTFRDQMSTLPDPEDVLSGKVAKVSRDIKDELLYAFVMQLVYLLGDEGKAMLVDNIPNLTGGKPPPRRLAAYKRADNFCGYVRTFSKPEFAVVAVQHAMKSSDNMPPQYIPNLKSFLQENGGNISSRIFSNN